MPNVEKVGGPIAMSIELALLTGVLTFIVAAATLTIIFLLEWLVFTPVLYCVIPLAAWGGFVLLPMWYNFMRSAQLIPRAFSNTAEAWNSRAVATRDVQDLRTAMVTDIHPRIVDAEPEALPAPVVDAEPRMIPMNTVGGTQMVPIPDAAQTPLTDAQLPPPPGTPKPVVRTKFWNVPIPDPEQPSRMKTVKVREGKLRSFLQGIFTVGWKRKEWVPHLLTRAEYEAIMKMVTECKIIVGRGRGTPGTLAIESPQEALTMFGLVG